MRCIGSIFMAAWLAGLVRGYIGAKQLREGGKEDEDEATF
jgi:hypothetical protein